MSGRGETNINSDSFSPKKRKSLQYECIHYNKVACAASHYEEVEDFMRSKVPVPAVENRQLQCIDDSAYGVDDTARQQPSECGG